MNLSQSIVDDLLAEVREGSLRPGSKLPTEHQLVERYGVGRGTAREAVQELVALGVADVRPGRGARVRSLSGEAVLDTAVLLQDEDFAALYDLRRLLETEVAAKAASRADEVDLKALEQAQVRCRVALRDDRSSFYRGDLDFHDALARASHNPVYAKVLDAAADMLLVARRATAMIPAAVESAVVEHDEVLEAVRARDPEAARAAMARHMESAIAALEQARQA